MGALRDLARSAVSDTVEIMKDRTKVDMDDIISAYPEGVTITGFDFLTGDNGDYPVIIFAEDNNSYFFGGAQLNKMLKKISDHFSGDNEAASAEILNEGGIPIQMETTKTKKGRKFTKVTVLDTM